MPILPIRKISLRPIVAETGPISASAPAYQSDTTPTTVTTGGTFATRHQQFVDQVLGMDHCFKATEIYGFGTDDLYDHLLVALQDNLIVQDDDRYCSGQVAYELKAKTQGYTYKSGLKPQTSGFAPVI